MKSPLRPFRATILDLTREACEKLAAEILAPEAVRALITQRALQGYSSVAVRPPRAVDLRRTGMARTTVAQLEKDGFSASWEPCALIEDGQPRNTLELVIRWNV